MVILNNESQKGSITDRVLTTRHNCKEAKWNREKERREKMKQNVLSRSKALCHNYVGRACLCEYLMFIAPQIQNHSPPQLLLIAFESLIIASCRMLPYQWAHFARCEIVALKIPIKSNTFLILFTFLHDNVVTTNGQNWILSFVIFEMV